MTLVCDTCFEYFEYDKEDIIRVAGERSVICPNCHEENRLPEDDLVYDDPPVETEIDEDIKLEEEEEEDNGNIKYSGRYYR